MIQSMDTVQANATEIYSLWAIIWTQGSLETIKYVVQLRKKPQYYVILRDRTV